MHKQGTVRFFNNQKGSGFISQHDNRKELFVHATGLIDEIQENDQVSCDVAQGKKGPNAINVNLI